MYIGYISICIEIHPQRGRRIHLGPPHSRLDCKNDSSVVIVDLLVVNRCLLGTNYYRVN